MTKTNVLDVPPGCTGLRYLLNPDAPDEGTDIVHDETCPIHHPPIDVTMTVGQLRAILAAVPDDRPVTVCQPDGSWFLNLTGFSDFNEEPSLVLYTRDNFDTRQF